MNDKKQYGSIRVSYPAWEALKAQAELEQRSCLTVGSDALLRGIAERKRELLDEAKRMRRLSRISQ